VTKLQRKVQQLQEELNHMFRYVGEKETPFIGRGWAASSCGFQYCGTVGLVPRVHSWVVQELPFSPLGITHVSGRSFVAFQFGCFLWSSNASRFTAMLQTRQSACAHLSYVFTIGYCRGEREGAASQLNLTQELQDVIKRSMQTRDE
jgi:hypothetical protein